MDKPGVAQGAKTSEASRPPEASIGEIPAKGLMFDPEEDEGVCLWVCGGQTARARTSCECMRFEPLCTQEEEERGLVEDPGSFFGAETFAREKRQTFWSTPEVKTELPSYMKVKRLKIVAMPRKRTYRSDSHT